MALMTPMLTTIESFDATKGQKVSFIVTSGDQVVKNRITVRNNSTNEIIYQNTIETFELENEIPANVLSNDGYYNCYINTYNINDDISANSNTVAFYCLNSATLTFTNIPPDGVISSTEYKFSVLYQQAQHELLNGLYFRLYDESETLLQSSELITSSFTPPLQLSYSFSGLEDNKIYKIQAVATTINGSSVETPMTQFLVRYSYDASFFQIVLENKCREGYIYVESHLVSVDGEQHGGKWGDSVLALSGQNYVEWSQGFSFFSDSFVFMKWWLPMLRGTTDILMSEDKSTRIEIAYKRGIPPYETEPKDYIEVTGFKNEEQYMLLRSNYLDIQNNNSLLMSYVKINGNNYDIRFAKIDTDGYNIIWNGESDAYWTYETRVQWNLDYPSAELIHSNYIVWNGDSNTEYNRITDLYFNDQPELEEAITGQQFYRPQEGAYITDYITKNSVVDDVYITRNVNEEFTTDILTWTAGTVFHASMNGNLSAGNIEYITDNISNIKIKRRTVGELDWITVYNQVVTQPIDLSFNIQDSFVPSGKDFEYAIVPCINNTEQVYYTSQVHSYFDGVFVSELDRSAHLMNFMKLYSNVSYNQDNITQDIGILKPFNQVYPTIIQNSKTNFRSLTVSGDILDNDYGFDANEINDIKDKWMSFLTNGRIKFVKDWNGDIIMGKITTPPSFTYKNNTSMIIPTISFVITEQGKYNNVDDLRRNGYLD